MNTTKTTTTSLITRDYQGMTFTFREDGYFNMTKAAQQFGKRIDNWLANLETQEYMDALEELNPGIPVIITKKGYHTSPSVGTWGHPKLAVFFARWLDVKFAVFCDAVIEDILKGAAKVEIVKPQESAVVQVMAGMTPEQIQLMGMQLSTMQQMFAQHSAVFQPLEHDLSHPTRIRQWFNEQPKEPLPDDLQDTQVETKTVPTMDQKTAEKVAKLANRAKANDEGSEIAQRHLEAVAKKHGAKNMATKPHSQRSTLGFTPVFPGD